MCEFKGWTQDKGGFAIPKRKRKGEGRGKMAPHEPVDNAECCWAAASKNGRLIAYHHWLNELIVSMSCLMPSRQRPHIPQAGRQKKGENTNTEPVALKALPGRLSGPCLVLMVLHADLYISNLYRITVYATCLNKGEESDGKWRVDSNACMLSCGIDHGQARQSDMSGDDENRVQTS